MAAPLKFVGDFRNAVCDLLIAIEKLDSLQQFSEDLGYSVDTFAALTGDITPAEFWDAVEAWEAASASIETSITTLSKLRA